MSMVQRGNNLSTRFQQVGPSWFTLKHAFSLPLRNSDT